MSFSVNLGTEFKVYNGVYRSFPVTFDDETVFPIPAGTAFTWDGFSACPDETDTEGMWICTKTIYEKPLTQELYLLVGGDVELGMISYQQVSLIVQHFPATHIRFYCKGVPINVSGGGDSSGGDDGTETS